MPEDNLASAEQLKAAGKGRAFVYGQVLHEISESRTEAKTLFPISSVQTLPRADLVQIQGVLRHGSQFGIWVTPAEWAPNECAAISSINIEKRVLHFLSNEVKARYFGIAPTHVFARPLLERAITLVVRYLVLLRYGPSGLGGKRGQPLEPVRVANLGYTVLPMIASAALAKGLQRLADGDSFTDTLLIAHLTMDDIHLITTAQSMRDECARELRRMAELQAKGFWSDCPPLLRKLKKHTKVTNKRVEPVAEDVTEEHLPYPDEWVSEFGTRCDWLIKNVGPELQEVLQDFQPIWRRFFFMERSKPRLTAWTRTYLENRHWVDATGAALIPPFELHLSVKSYKNKGEENFEAWPPKTASQVFLLVRLIQAAHIFVVGLSTGARRSELASLQRDCIKLAKDGRTYADGRTFKLVQAFDGEERDWALPDFAVECIERQAKLARLVEQLSATGIDPSEVVPGTFLWASISTRREGEAGRQSPMSASGFKPALLALVKCLGMNTTPGGQLINTHRFRKTLARLAGLAMSHAPKVLQAVFGHESVEMTLYYILADKDVMAEAETVGKELRIMCAEAVVSDMVAAEERTRIEIPQLSDSPAELPFAGYGGRAAERIYRAVGELREENFRRAEDFGADTARDLAEKLSMKGDVFHYVRQGVICTAGLGQAGPCRKGKAKPEPSNCGSVCTYRLEEAWLREDVDASIAHALEIYKKEIADGHDLVASFWAGQIRENVIRFPDLEAKWMTDETVQVISAEAVT